MSQVDRIARLHIVLDDTEPAIWRAVEVPLAISLKGLHEVIQAAMPFEDEHLFGFRIDGKHYTLPDAEFDAPGTYSAELATLGAAWEEGIRQIAYTYDFGDNWQHTITVEEIFEADPTAEYPRLLAGEGRAPPEDVGGTFGYEEFQDALENPDHPEHASLVDWCGGSFDPSTMDVEMIRARMGRLVRAKR